MYLDCSEPSNLSFRLSGGVLVALNGRLGATGGKLRSVHENLSEEDLTRRIGKAEKPGISVFEFGPGTLLLESLFQQRLGDPKAVENCRFSPFWEITRTTPKALGTFPSVAPTSRPSTKRRCGPSQCGEENFWQVPLRRIAASLPLPILVERTVRPPRPLHRFPGRAAHEEAAPAESVGRSGPPQFGGKRCRGPLAGNPQGRYREHASVLA